MTEYEQPHDQEPQFADGIEIEIEPTAEAGENTVTGGEVDAATAVPAFDIPTTGEPRVDAALASLGDIDSSAPAHAVETLGQVYDRLHRVLTQP